MIMEIKRKKSEKMMAWIARNKFFLIIIPCSLIIVASGVVSTLIIINADRTEIVEEPEPEIPAPEPLQKYFSHLTGVELTSKEAITSPINCVMIENSPNARPQSGLKNAGVVYEAEAEGGISRFLAVYQNSMPEKIGPVRSVRMHFLEWSKPYGCLLAHAGGAWDALQAIANSSNGYMSVSENRTNFWRASDRYAPHNLYTNSEKLTAANESKGNVSSNYLGFPRAIASITPTRSETAASTINIVMSSALWNVTYQYDASSNSYLRSHQSGGAHMDKDVNGNLTQNAPNVVVAIMTNRVARPGGAYYNVTTSGSGVAYIFQNGEYIAATWSKSSAGAELEFKNEEGAEIVFNRGQVWITAVPNGKTVSWN